MVNLRQTARKNMLGLIDQNRSIIEAAEKLHLSDFPRNELKRFESLAIELEQLLQT